MTRSLGLALALLCIAAPAHAAPLAYMELFSGPDLAGQSLGPLDVGANFVMGMVSTADPGGDPFTVDLPAGLQLVGVELATFFGTGGQTLLQIPLDTIVTPVGTDIAVHSLLPDPFTGPAGLAANALGSFGYVWVFIATGPTPPAEVPEPAIVSLLGAAGVALVGLTRRRRGRAPQPPRG